MATRLSSPSANSERIGLRWRRNLLVTVTLWLASLSAFAQPAGFHELKIGEAAPDFALPGIDGQTHRLADYRGAKLLMIAFISNHCPVSHAAEIRIKQLVAEMKGKSFALVAINPNNPEGLRSEELGYSKYDDSFDDMKKYAAEQGFDFPYLYDGVTQTTAKAYGCLATPHVFLFDADRKLRYQGEFDDSPFPDPATVKAQPARDAVLALLADRPVPVPVTKPRGCSTKWLEKKASVVEAKAKLDHTPVDLEAIDDAGVAALRQNHSGNLRLINVWATWCPQCLVEFPELVATARRYGMRDFEFVSISNDRLGDLPKAKAFLEKQGAAPNDKVKRSLKKEGRTTDSYLYTGKDLNVLMQTLDPEWPGALPDTVLVAPGGKILWSQHGPVDGPALRAKVLEILGCYYVPAKPAAKAAIPN